MIEENMEENAQEQITSNKYVVKLENFDGPLDLLLHLIKDAKMDINDIKLSQITEPYLQYLSQIDAIDMEQASEFITVAATLIEIKSKELLPKEEVIIDEEDPEEKLKRQVKEYALFKEASEKLHNIENIDKFYKQPDKNADKARVVLTDFVLEKLLDAFVGILAKVDKKEKSEEPKKIVKDRFTVAEKIVQIRQTMTVQDKVKFSDLFEEENTKSEVINVFLALLELLKMQIVRVVQKDIFEEIEIFSNIKGDVTNE